jgi:hypothetical protein
MGVDFIHYICAAGHTAITMLPQEKKKTFCAKLWQTNDTAVAMEIGIGRVHANIIFAVHVGLKAHRSDS